MQNPKAIEARRKTGEFHAPVSNHRPECIGCPPPVQAAELQAGLQGARGDADPPDAEILASAGSRTLLMLRLEKPPAPKARFQLIYLLHIGLGATHSGLNHRRKQW